MFGWAGVLSVILLRPILGSGYLLGHDMVFTPSQPLDRASVGLSSASPRAVPLDALVALADKLVDGAVVGRIAVLAPLLAVGTGAAALLSSRAMSARLAACTCAIWTPFAVERMALGQWALLWAYAALPWLILAVVHGHGRVGWAARALALAAASITPTGGLIAATTAVVTAGVTRRPRRELIAVTALSLTLQLPWLVPSLVSSAAATSDPNGVAAFAARAEHPGGPLLSLLAGGGVWDSEVVPASRGGLSPWFGLVVLLLAVCLGGRQLIRLLGVRPVVALGVLAGAGLALASLSSVAGGDVVVRWAVGHVPGAGLLRDAQKWVTPLALANALVFGAAVDRLAEWLRADHRSMQWRTLLGVSAVVVPVLLLRDGPATLRPTFEPVHYPRDWSAVAERMDGGDAAVVPFGSYRSFSWAPGRSVLDPAPRLLHSPTVVDDRLAVSGQLLAGEDPRAADVAAALAGDSGLSSRLADLGITWVVVEHDTPGNVPDLSDLRIVYRGNEVSLYRVRGPVQHHPDSGARTAAVIGADLVAGCVLLGVVLAAAHQVARSRRRHGRSGTVTLL